tara:strand:- start:2886 stop:4121 length:1236 start_codon:yes stop_codon:yes gene_type:complete
MPPKTSPNFKVVGTKKFKLSELPVDNLISLAKTMNKSIRAEHVEKSKQRIKAAKQAEKVDVKGVKAELLQELKSTLILTAKRKKAQLIADIMRNKKHLPKQKKLKGTESQPSAPAESKPQYITRRIGGKIRRIPVAKLDEAAAKKESKEKPKLGTKENPIKKTKPNKSMLPQPPFDCDKCPKKSYTKRCVACMREDLKKAEKAEETKTPVTEEEKTEAKIGSTRLRTKLADRFASKAEKAEKKEEKKEDKPKEDAGALKRLKAELKAKGVPKVALKFIKSVKQAEEKLAELDEEEPEDKKVQVAEKVLQQIPMKNQLKIRKLIVKILPRNEYTLQDQVDYFEDLKEMGDNWDMSAVPRQRYDKFDEDEKLLFELLYPAIFDKKAQKKASEARKQEKAKRQAKAKAAKAKDE